MSRFYSVNEAAKELFKFASVEAGADPEKDPDAQVISELRKWSQKIINAVLVGELIGVYDSSAIDPISPGAVVAAVLCKVRGDDLNTWLESIRCEYKFDEDPVAQPVAEQETLKTTPIKDFEIIRREAQIVGLKLYKESNLNIKDVSNNKISKALVSHLQSFDINKTSTSIRNALNANKNKNIAKWEFVKPAGKNS